MTKKLFSTLFAATIAVSVLFSLFACAKTPQQSTISDVERYSYLAFEIDDEDECVTVTGYDKKTIPDQLVIPDSINGYPVTKIAKKAFYDCKTITSVTVPDGVGEIEESAFENCTSLKSARLPNDLAKISRFLFLNCTSLENVNIPEKVTNIGTGAFLSCRKLIYVRLPKTLEKISSSAFSDCVALSVSVPSETEVESNAFGCNCINAAHASSGSIIIDRSLKVQKNSFDKTTIFATFEYAPDSWFFYDYSSASENLRELWADSAFVYYGCSIKDDENGEKYVYSVPAVKYSRSTPTKTEYFSIPRSGQYSGSAALPYRDGYAFLGWATTEGKTTPDYTFVSTKYTPTSGSSSLNVMGTLPDSDEEEIISLGTTLYTVWQKLPD